MNIVQQFKYNNSNDYELIKGSENKLLNLYKSVSLIIFTRLITI